MNEERVSMIIGGAKNSRMYGIILLCWFAAGLYFNPRILALLIGPENILAKAAIIAFAILLNLFWLYGFYHLVTILFSYRKSADPLAGHPKDKSILLKNPAVALLYTTCDDFNEEAVLSCVHQDYEGARVFILDDGTDAEYRRRIDGFAEKYPRKISVIRRVDKSGYKAGNINHALRNISGCEYFSVSDADTLLPAGYVRGLLPYFTLSPKIAYVQSRQRINPRQGPAFARYLGYQIELHCDHYLRVKNRYGFVMFYGHGALIRYDVWKELGGMPEVATEDLAFSLKAREKGYSGVYAEDAACYEDYPPTYQQYRKRNEKWIRGTAECLLKFYPSFFKCGHISGTEKIDVLVSGVSLLLALPFFLLLLLTGVVLPVYFSHFCFQGPMFNMPVAYEGSLIKPAVGISGNLFWTWDFFILLIIAVAGPVLPALAGFMRQPANKFWYVIMHTFMFYATQIVSAVNLLVYVISGKAGFPVTGRKDEPMAQSRVRGSQRKSFPRVCRRRQSVLESLKEPVSNRKPMIFAEAVCVAMFLTAGTVSNNLWLLTASCGLIMGMILYRFGLEHKAVRLLALIPALFLLAVILLIGKNIQ